MVCSSNMNRSMVARSLLGRGGRGGSTSPPPAPARTSSSLAPPSASPTSTPSVPPLQGHPRRPPPQGPRPWQWHIRYKRNGLLPMLKRNSTVKTGPRRWQDNAGDGPFDVVLTFLRRRSSIRSLKI